MASAAAAAAMTRAVRPTVPKAMAKTKMAGSVASPFTGGNTGFLRPSAGKRSVGMSGPRGAFKTRTPGNISPNFTGANPAKYNLGQMTTSGPARNAGNASTFGMTDRHMGLGDFAGGGGGSDEFSMGDSMKDFLMNAAMSMLSPDEQMASGGGGGGGGPSAGPGSAYRGGHGVDSEVIWNFGPPSNLKHERI